MENRPKRRNDGQRIVINGEEEIPPVRRRGRPVARNNVPRNPPQHQANLEAQVALLLQRLEAQEAEIQRLRAAPIDPVAPEAPVVPEAPIAPPQPRPVAQGAELYEKFTRMKPEEFDGSTDPLVADEWLAKTKRTLDFMDISDTDKVKCASFILTKGARYWWDTVILRRNVAEMIWADFEEEFNRKYFNMKTMNIQQKEFNNLKQGNMSVTEAVVKFDQLARLCPQLVPTEEERVRRMMEMFRPDLALAIDSGNQPPTTVADCIERAVRAEYRLNQVKEERAQFYKARKEEKTQGKSGENQKKSQGQSFQGHQQNNWKRNFNGENRSGPQEGSDRNVQPRIGRENSYPTCPKCMKNHLGECLMRTLSCFNCGKTGHFISHCPYPKPLQAIPAQIKPPTSRVNMLQAENTTPEQAVRVNETAPPPVRIYAYTNADTIANTSNNGKMA